MGQRHFAKGKWDLRRRILKGKESGEQSKDHDIDRSVRGANFKWHNERGGRILLA